MHVSSPVYLYRLQSAEKQAEKSNREYQMGKLDALRAEVDEATKKFEDCQDAYATELFTFMSKEQLYTEKLQEVGGTITHTLLLVASFTPSISLSSLYVVRCPC